MDNKDKINMCCCVRNKCNKGNKGNRVAFDYLDSL